VGGGGGAPSSVGRGVTAGTGGGGLARAGGGAARRGAAEAAAAAAAAARFSTPYGCGGAGCGALSSGAGAGGVGAHCRGGEAARCSSCLAVPRERKPKVSFARTKAESQFRAKAENRKSEPGSASKPEMVNGSDSHAGGFWTPGETCPVSTDGGTRRVRLVREGGTRRVRLVREGGGRGGGAGRCLELWHDDARGRPGAGAGAAGAAPGRLGCATRAILARAEKARDPAENVARRAPLPRRPPRRVGVGAIHHFCRRRPARLRVLRRPRRQPRLRWLRRLGSGRGAPPPSPSLPY
jgi:hypothetical protein